MTSLTGDLSPGQVPNPNTINDFLLYLQTGVQHGCPLRGSTQQLTQIDIDTQSQTVDGAWGLMEEQEEGLWVLMGIELHKKTNKVN